MTIGDYSEIEKLTIYLDYMDMIPQKTKKSLLDEFSCLGDFVKAVKSETNFLKNVIKEENCEYARLFVKTTSIDIILKDLQKMKVTCLTEASEKYPKALREINFPPFVLYCMGDVDLFNANSIAIVGPRKCSSYGANVTKAFAKEFVSNNLCVVSGLADGVDYLAHSEALKGNGKTIGVLASGFCYIYPKYHFSLVQEISEKGLVVSEEKPKVSPKPYLFPKRNRIIAGISKGVFLVEAGEKSGSLITVEHAINMSKPIYAVPNEITSKNGIGVNMLLKSKIAKFVTCPNDVIQDLKTNENVVCENENMIKASLYNSFKNIKAETNNKKMKTNKQNTENNRHDDVEYAACDEFDEIHDELTEDEVILKAIRETDGHFDNLVIHTKFSPSKLNEKLFFLELSGHIQKVGGNYYKI